MTVERAAGASAPAPQEPPGDPSGLGTWVARLQIVLFGMALVMMATDLWRIALTTGAGPGAPIGADTAYGLAAMSNRGVSVLYFLMLIVAGVVSLNWIGRTNENAQVWTSNMRISPSWSVGWFFIPVANLWKPFQGVNDTWRVSEDPAPDWPLRPAPSLLTAWWALFIISNLLGNVVGRAEAAAHTPAQEHVAAMISLVDDGLEAALALVFRQVALRLTAMQVARRGVPPPMAAGGDAERATA